MRVNHSRSIESRASGRNRATARPCDSATLSYGNILVIAYRGVSFYAPEDLVVVLACHMGAAYIPTDKRQCDGRNRSSQYVKP